MALDRSWPAGATLLLKLPLGSHEGGPPAAHSLHSTSTGRRDAALEEHFSGLVFALRSRNILGALFRQTK